jgi:hypothetical protein
MLSRPWGRHSCLPTWRGRQQCLPHFCLAVFVAAWLAHAHACAEAPDPTALAKRIDFHLAEHWQADQVQPAPLADDAEFIRRAYLDLTGRVPVPREVYDFLVDKSADKRRRLIDDLLDTPRHALHFANVWRALLIPETAASAEARIFQPGFEAWLKQKVRSNVPFDRLVNELLAVPIAGERQTPESVLKNPEQPNPLAFFAVKDASPANLAATTTRMFLGIQIECAQCHDHPFARWSREQFWNQAAFFAGVERQGDGIFAPLSETIDRREIKVGDTKKIAKAMFLDDKEPAWKDKASPRAALAEWIASANNPYFARATVNRLWGQFFGRGIVEPVDDFNDQNLPSHPILLDELARAFVEAKFDVRFIIRAICRSEAYQRTSARTHASQDDPRHFARMAVKGFTGEQFFDSLALVTGYKERKEGDFGRERTTVRTQFLDQFAPQGKLSAPETSILQALTLMNGKFINESTTLAKSSTLTAVIEMPKLDTAGRIDSLYVIALSRKPTPEERERLLSYVERGGAGEQKRRLADVFWALLNSAEFRLNH